MLNVIVVDGPNLNMVGAGMDASVFGDTPVKEYLASIAPDFKGVTLEYFQSNSEGELIDIIQVRREAMVVNLGGLSHSSIALADAIRASRARAVEVHLSNISSTDGFRNKSLITPACDAIISGMGVFGYRAAVEYLIYKDMYDSKHHRQ